MNRFESLASVSPCLWDKPCGFSKLSGMGGEIIPTTPTHYSVQFQAQFFFNLLKTIWKFFMLVVIYFWFLDEKTIMSHANKVIPIISISPTMSI